MRNLEFESRAFEDFMWWVHTDRKKALRLIRILDETRAQPYDGIGRPEALKHDLNGCWSKRIDEENRVVYEVLPNKIRILACRYHYK